MNEQNTKYLLETYPKLYRQNTLPMTETCMCWLFECSDGWLEIVNEASEKLEKLNNTTYAENPIEAVQVKEKYGTIRIYLSTYDDDINAIVEAAETKSAITCEQCGMPGVIRDSSWIKTQCSACHAADGASDLCL